MSKFVGYNAVMRRKFIILNAYIRKEKKSEITNLSLYLENSKKKKKGEQNKPKAKQKEVKNTGSNRN